MIRTNKSKFLALMAFHMLWGSVLWFSISKYGLGISTDSVHLLFGGLNLAMGRGLISFDGSRILGWPPLYSVLLAFIHLVSGWDVFVSANVLQALAFIGLSLCLSLLFLKIFPGNFLLAFAGNLLSDIGVVVLTGFTMVGSDYVHLALVILFIWLAGTYIENNSPRILLAMFVVGMLAMLQRYLGIAVIATGTATVFLFSGGTLLQRIGRGLLISLAALPSGVWLFITSGSVERRAPISFDENFNWFSKSILEWFFPAEALKAHLGLYIIYLWILIFGLIVFLLIGSSHHNFSASYTFPVFVFGILYLSMLFGSASIAYYNKLGGRFLLPLYIPFITLLTVTVDDLLRLASTWQARILNRVISAGLIAALLIVTGLLLNVTLPVILDSHANGAADGENAINTTAWRENKTIEYWLNHRPTGQYWLFSNYPDGIAFYSGHSCNRSPIKNSGPYGTQEFPVSQYASELFSSGQDVYIIWIEPNDHSYFYEVDELSSIAQIEPLFSGPDGAVYRLKPIAGS